MFVNVQRTIFEPQTQQLKEKQIHIILPVYNPIAGWAENVIDRFRALEVACDQIAPLKLIVVNDGSNKGDVKVGGALIVERIPECHFISYDENRGKGYALRQGVMAADSAYILYTDVDFPYTHQSMMEMIHAMLSGKWDAVIGTRDDSYYSQLPGTRRRISHYLKQMNARVLGLRVADTQGGLKAFSAELKSHFLATQIDRYLFDLEFIYRLSKKKSVRMLPLKVKLRDGVEFSQVPMRILMGEFRNFLKVFFSRNRN